MSIEDCQVGIRAGCCDNARLDAKCCSNSSCIRNCTTLQLFGSLTLCYVQCLRYAESLWRRHLYLLKPFFCLQYRLSSCPQAELGSCSPQISHTTLSWLLLLEHEIITVWNRKELNLQNSVSNMATRKAAAAASVALPRRASIRQAFDRRTPVCIAAWPTRPHHADPYQPFPVVRSAYVRIRCCQVPFRNTQIRMLPICLAQALGLALQNYCIEASPALSATTTSL